MGWQNEVRATEVRALRNAAKRCGVLQEEWLSLTRDSSRAALERVAGLCAATSGATARQTAAKAAAAAAWSAIRGTYRKRPRPTGKGKAKAQGKARGKAKAKARATPDDEEEDEAAALADLDDLFLSWL